MESESLRRDVVVRRVAHVLVALAPLYYLFPVELPFLGIRRWVLLIAFFALVIGFEGIRLWKGLTVLGLRPHEKDQIASFVWAAAGITLVLWVFEPDIASAAIVGMAIVDPLAGELRAANKSDRISIGVPILAYFMICVAVLLVAGSRELFPVISLSVLGSIAAVAAERPKIDYVDDDFLMLVVPALAMALLSLVASTA